MEECHSRQLRPKTMLSYEHTLKLFSFWLTGRKKISRIEDIKEKHIREYIIELQTRGKYTVRPSGYDLLETRYFGNDPASIRREFVSTLRCVIMG